MTPTLWLILAVLVFATVAIGLVLFGPQEDDQVVEEHRSLFDDQGRRRR